MKKIICLLTFCLAGIMVLSACSSQKLSEDFEEDTVKSAAEEVIGLVNDENYDAISDDYLAEEAKAALTPEVLASAIVQTMPDAGNFVKFSNESVIATTDEAGNNYAVASIMADYENQKVTYTLVFNTEMKLTGLYMK